MITDALLMTWVWLGWLCAAFLLQVVICRFKVLWRWRRGWGGVVVAMYIVSVPLLLVSSLRLWCGLAALGVTLYLLINAARLWMNRFDDNYLRNAVLWNVLWLSALIGMIALSSLTMQAIGWHFNTQVALEAFLLASVVVGIFLLGRTPRALARYRAEVVEPVTRTRELPAVTLAVPARNETHALEEMLSLAIKSDYPKLEILVLDDCSQDATAEVIRSFAHDGVRFVQGDVPAEGWLGRNYACETLAREASGALVIFAGVDTHFDAHSISKMVSYMVRRKAEMLSVLPYRRQFDVVPTFFEQLRNFWQVALPLGSKNIPISNPCWAIWADSLRRAGGFQAYKSSVFPEVHFAKSLMSKKAYRFVMSDEAFGVTTRKRLSSQFATATRTFYPLLRRRPFVVLLTTFLLGTLMLLPFAVLPWQLFHQSYTRLTALALVSVLAFTLTHLLILRRTTPHGWFVGLVNFPVLVSLEIALYNWSMLQFEFGEVNWKGRNVCYPIMEAIPMKKFTQQLQRTVRR